MSKGFLPGDSVDERIALLSRPHRVREHIGGVSARVNDVLDKATALVRERFGGKTTYAAVLFERVDWASFDIISMDLYRSAEIAGQFAEGVRNLVTQEKPVAITEFGAASHHGAGDRDARGLEIVKYDKDTREPIRLNGEYARDEAGRAAYPRELLEAFDAGGIDSTFVSAFALYDHPHRTGGDPPRGPGSGQLRHRQSPQGPPGATCPDMPWEPKAASTAVADCNRDRIAPGVEEQRMPPLPPGAEAGTP
ncbi:hypothetical protein ACIF80_16710 [Streptomyces sp. NPDC085927]|uniref:hypothetical protein n=1 Tax=Streptomyces sp. NPDC085927 TaxID=3365738 RepID=UPI0037CCCB58